MATTELRPPAAMGRSFHATLGAGIDGVVLREHATLEPGPRQVLVRVRAASLNYRELLVLGDDYPLPLTPDVVLACDGAGEIAALGEGVDAFAVGDRVSANVFPRWLDGPFAFARAEQLGGSVDGMLTEFALLDADALLAIPDHLSFEQAACLPCAALTAWNALTGGRGLVAGESVLTLGTGSVSLFALQLAKAAGAYIVATTSSPAKAEKLRALGADAVLDYRRRSDWPHQVVELTGGGADHVVEVAGTLAQTLQAVAVDGELALVGSVDADAAATPVDIGSLRGRLATIRSIAVGSRAQFVALNRAVHAGRLEPVIDRIFPFDETVEALRYFARERPFGKVVITVP